MTIELIGWGSSLVLFATLTKQIWQQWQARDTDGVSPWLFIGQMTASLGFTTYSALIGNWVFVGHQRGAGARRARGPRGPDAAREGRTVMTQPRVQDPPSTPEHHIDDPARRDPHVDPPVHPPDPHDPPPAHDPRDDRREPPPDDQKKDPPSGDRRRDPPSEPEEPPMKDPPPTDPHVQDPPIDPHTPEGPVLV